MLVLQFAWANLIISLKIYVFQPKVSGTLMNPVLHSLRNINAFVIWNNLARKLLEFLWKRNINENHNHYLNYKYLEKDSDGNKY